MVVDNIRPHTIGSLREKVSELPRRSNQSEITPPSTPPMKPQIAGSEAMNPAGELYGLARLRQQVGAETANVADLGRQILDDVRKYVSGRTQSDDMCLACFGRSHN